MDVQVPLLVGEEAHSIASSLLQSKQAHLHTTAPMLLPAPPFLTRVSHSPAHSAHLLESPPWFRVSLAYLSLKGVSWEPEPFPSEGEQELE